MQILRIYLCSCLVIGFLIQTMYWYFLQHYCSGVNHETPKNPELSPMQKQVEELLMKDFQATVHDVMTQAKTSNPNALGKNQCKKQIAQDFMNKFCNPSWKMSKPGTLNSYKNLVKSTPAQYFHNTREIMDVEEVDNYWKKVKARRLKLGDDDPLMIPEVQEELQNKTFRIPNIVNFVWFGADRRFKVDNFISMMGALRYQRPKVVLFHCDAKPIGEYWKATKKLAGSRLKLVKRTKSTEIFGHAVTVVEHSTDIARIEIMMEIGGIYLDGDSTILKSIDHFRNYTYVMAQSDFGELASAILFGNRDAWFPRRWYYEYKYYRDELWGLNAVLVPWGISELFPDTVYVAYEEICRPAFQETDLIFRDLWDWKRIYVMHLYSRVMLEKDGTSERPLMQLAVLNTTYGAVARHVLWGDKIIRDVTDWIVTCDIEPVFSDLISSIESFKSVY